MNKTIGYEAIIDPVQGFNDARNWIRRMIAARIVKCGQCSNPATHVFWQDQAEFYIRCDDHPETGEQWTGSTRWNPISFSINVLKDKAEEWIKTLGMYDAEKIRIESFDATDYYELIADDQRGIRHYLKGSEHEEGMKVYAHIWPLTNGEYAYEISTEWPRSCYTDAIQGAWPTEQEALEAARLEAGVQ